MSEVFVVTHGDYSDYAVECVFESEADATEYVRLANLADVRRRHDLWHNSTSEYGRWYRVEHEKPFEECERCQKDLATPERYGEYRVERFAFHPAGEIPHGEVSSQDSGPGE